MRIVLLVTLFAALGTAGLAGSSAAAVPAPTGLHGFLLVASETQTSVFHRTPSFAWKPVSGANRYELQLSISSSFHDNGILYDSKKLLTPVAAPPLTLPWITGSPHSLYARVRAILAGGRTSPWSAPYGFDMVAPAAPKPLSSFPGLLRWTTVDGADAYEIWLLDKTPVTSQIEVVRTNVLDERDFYGSSWPSAVRWRIRALRMDVLGNGNGLPAASYGPWSPIYHSTNSAPTVGPLQLGGTVSDVVANGMTPYHRLMPGFVWSGNETLDGTPAPFFRVYVFTDSQCLNPVFIGPAVPSPAYAPRLNGPGLALPPTEGNAYVDPGTPSLDIAQDGNVLAVNEQMGAASPTTGTSASGSEVAALGVIGPPVDLWDDDAEPGSGYYWTVVGVQGAADGYQDLELPQDVCAAGRVQRLVIASTPSLTAGRAPFATGLSSKGRLVSAAQTPKFYGEPLVAWTAAPGASLYEIQWAKRVYPFKARASRYTFATSAVLPLKPGNWWYRVRGFDYNLPSVAQQMAWSNPTEIAVTAPKFRVTSVGHRRHARFRIVK
jgi:hypothetical protein